MSAFADDIAAVLKQHIDAGEIPGGVVLVNRHGEIDALVADGVSDTDPNVMLATDNIFGVFSMTKPVVAACVLMLVADGHIGLHDPLSRYVPEFGAPRMVRTLRPGQQHRIEMVPGLSETDAVEPEFDYEPTHREITVRDLLTFTSGLQTIGITNPAIPPILPTDSLADWVAKLGEVPLEFQPGTRWAYSNATGYDVLGRVVEVASGHTLAEFADTRVFGPLGMQHTGFGVQPWMTDKLAPLGLLAAAPVARPDYHSGSAGLFSTAEDYAKFAQMLLGEGTLDGIEVLSASMVKLMCSNQIGELHFPGVRAAQYAQPLPTASAPNIRYGFGVATVTDTGGDVVLPVGSFGWDGVGTRRFWVIPELETAVVMLIPGMGPSADATHREIEGLIAGTSRS